MLPPGLNSLHHCTLLVSILNQQINAQSQSLQLRGSCPRCMDRQWAFLCLESRALTLFLSSRSQSFPIDAEGVVAVGPTVVKHRYSRSLVNEYI